MYFNQGYIDFLKQLEINNNQEWFKENKKWYELAVREPFKNLIDVLIPEVEKLDEHIDMESKDALFRINRDLRFSREKNPYKTHMAAGFSRGGRKSQYAGFYFQIGHTDILIGGGLPFIEKEVLRKIRREIGYNREAFQKISGDLKFKSLYGAVLGENDKDLPKAFADIYEETPMIANKQFYYAALYKTEDLLFNEDLAVFIINHFRAGMAFNDFLIRAISDFSGPTVKKNKSAQPQQN
jgi:uncharacterized protein (TIGR02453 family)